MRELSYDQRIAEIAADMADQAEGKVYIGTVTVAQSRAMRSARTTMAALKLLRRMHIQGVAQSPGALEVIDRALVDLTGGSDDETTGGGE